MIPLFTRAAVRALDADAIERLGVPGLVLMENAGAGATRLLREAFAAELGAPLVIGGPGQNGGDAWVVARQLFAAGISPRVVLVGTREKVRDDAQVNLAALERLGIPVTVLSEGETELARLLGQATMVVDGLFGTGLDRPVSGVYARAIELINAAARPVWALDLPSGIDADTGQVLGVAVRARATATFAAHKCGLFQHPGAEHAGAITLVSIGVPALHDLHCAVIEPADVAALLVPRAPASHKGTNGHVLALAGSPGKTGAALLAATGALRAGAGLVTVATSRAAQQALDQKVVEVMTEALEDADLVAQALSLARGKASALLGPGFGLEPVRREAARALAVQLPLPCVLDADALTAIALAPDLRLLREAAAPRVLTPHPGEAARLLGTGTAEVAHDRYGAAQRLAAESGQVVVLKGAGTLVAAPDGRLRVCRAGTPALGSAGTGDVLAGAIAALCATCPPFEAAWAGVELHAQAAEIVAASDRGTLANEVAAGLPRALERCRALAIKARGQAG
jgi:hydroxyethylthiazole kinase-like uncharacterized protein yjeF